MGRVSASSRRLNDEELSSHWGSGEGEGRKGIDRRAQCLQAEEMTANESTINEILLHLSGSVHSPTIQSWFSKSSYIQKIVFVNANLPETREKQTSINQRHKHIRMQ
jgi:hypothetical protein